MRNVKQKKLEKMSKGQTKKKKNVCVSYNYIEKGEKKTTPSRKEVKHKVCTYITIKRHLNPVAH